MNARLCELLPSTFISLHPTKASSFEEKQAPDSSKNIPSVVRRWGHSRFITLFKGRGLRQICIFSFGFSIITRPFNQTVGFFDR